MLAEAWPHHGYQLYALAMIALWPLGLRSRWSVAHAPSLIEPPLSLPPLSGGARLASGAPNRASTARCLE